MLGNYAPGVSRIHPALLQPSRREGTLASIVRQPPLPLPPDLSPEQIRTVQSFVDAYLHGAFPMAEPAPGPAPMPGRQIDWFVPDPRAIIPLEGGPLGAFHLPRSLSRCLRSERFRLTTDQAFSAVIRACAHPRPGREETWLDDRLIVCYELLHRCGLAHSVEVWPAQEGPGAAPIGGIYGVHIGSVFCAESMFCDPERGGSNASKVALAFLVRHLVRQGFRLLDVQIANPHTERFGVVEITASEYRKRLDIVSRIPAYWGVLEPRWS